MAFTVEPQEETRLTSFFLVPILFKCQFSNCGDLRLLRLHWHKIPVQPLHGVACVCAGEALQWLTQKTLMWWNTQWIHLIEERYWERPTCGLVSCQVGEMFSVPGEHMCDSSLEAWEQVGNPPPPLVLNDWRRSVIGDSRPQLDRQKRIPSPETKEQMKSLCCACSCPICQLLRDECDHIVSLVSRVRSLTREKEPLRSHWQEKPVVMKKKGKETLREWKRKRRKHSTSTISLQLWRKVRVTGQVGGEFSSAVEKPDPPSFSVVMKSAELWHVLKIQV